LKSHLEKPAAPKKLEGGISKAHPSQGHRPWLPFAVSRNTPSGVSFEQAQGLPRQPQAQRSLRCARRVTALRAVAANPPRTIDPANRKSRLSLASQFSIL